MHSSLTHRQATAAQLLLAFYAANGRPPSVRELTGLLGTLSVSSGYAMLQRLEAHGIIRTPTSPGASRTAVPMHLTFDELHAALCTEGSIILRPNKASGKVQIITKSTVYSATTMVAVLYYWSLAQSRQENNK